MSQPRWDPSERRWLLDDDAPVAHRARRRSVDVIDRFDTDGELDVLGPAAAPLPGTKLTRTEFTSGRRPRPSGRGYDEDADLLVAAPHGGVHDASRRRPAPGRRPTSAGPDPDDPLFPGRVVPEDGGHGPAGHGLDGARPRRDARWSGPEDHEDRDGHGPNGRAADRHDVDRYASAEWVRGHTGRRRAAPASGRHGTDRHRPDRDGADAPRPRPYPADDRTPGPVGAAAPHRGGRRTEERTATRYASDGYDVDGQRPDGHRSDGYGADGYGADGYGADGNRSNGARHGGAREDGSRHGGAHQDGARRDGVREDGARHGGARPEGARQDGHAVHAYGPDGHDAPGHVAPGHDASDHDTRGDAAPGHEADGYYDAYGYDPDGYADDGYEDADHAADEYAAHEHGPGEYGPGEYRADGYGEVGDGAAARRTGRHGAPVGAPATADIARAGIARAGIARVDTDHLDTDHLDTDPFGIVPDDVDDRPEPRTGTDSDRRRWPWFVGAATVAGAVAVPAVLGVFGGAGDSAGSSLSEGTASIGTSSEQERSSPGTVPPPPPAAGEVIYEVTGSGTSNTITYGRGTAVSQASGADLPWKQTVPGVEGEAEYTLAAQNSGGSGEISCTITVNGAVVAENSAKGDYAAVSCNGRR